MTTKEFISKAKSIHGDVYDYSKVEYKSYRGEVTVICPIHGEFRQRSEVHLRGSGCNECGYLKSSDANRFNKSIFVKKAISVHGSKYDYSLVDYKSNRVPVDIICSEHGVFQQSPWNHISGKGCKKCANDKLSANKVKSQNDFIADAIKVHGEKYDYSLVDYKTTHTKVKIICDEHGVFFQQPSNHLIGQGCPGCANEERSKKHSMKPTGWSLTNWEIAAQSSADFDSFKIYLVLAGDHKTGEYFLKVGRTYLKPNRRLKSLPYEYNVLSVFSSDPSTVYKLETIIKSKFKPHKVIPSLKFDGMHECFSIGIMNDLMTEFEKLNSSV